MNEKVLRHKEICDGLNELYARKNHDYAQVRILVDGTHYLKGMAMYSDDMPDGADIVFNTNKHTGTPKMDVLKKIQDDPDNPFGALIKANGQSHYIDADGNEKLSAINKLKEEGDWDKMSKNLSSQFLSKQPIQLIKKQLDLTYADAADEFSEICSLNNPTVKRKLLLDFADECDSAAVHLKAAALPRQSTQVILPLNAMKETEIFAPNYRDGEKVVLIRYIHITNYELRALLSDIYNISEEDELWLEKYYKTAYKLLEKDSFQTAVHTMASYRWHSVPRVQLAVIWSGIESLFNVNTEVSFRISLYIANFLGENEAQAQQIFKQVRKIYSSRSSAVHGNKTKDNLESAVEESANLLTRILRRCAELNKLPDVDNLAFRVDKQKQGIKCKILVP